MKNKRRRKQPIQLYEESVLIDSGHYDDNGDLINIKAFQDLNLNTDGSVAYKLTAEFPQHKVWMLIGEGELFEATGPSGIIDKLQAEAYEVPEKLKQWTGRAATAIDAINKAVIERYKEAGTPIVQKHRFRTDLYLYTASDEEIEDAINEAMKKYDETMRHATYRLLVNYRHMARDAVEDYKQKGIRPNPGGLIIDPTTTSSSGGSKETGY